MNHAIWYVTTDWKRPCPGETEVMWPDYFVKKATLKALDGDDDDQDEKLMKAVVEKARDEADKH